MCYTQENAIFHSIHSFFDEEYFLKYTNSYTKEHKLYDKLLDKISLEIELSVSHLSSEDRPTSMSIPQAFISPIQFFYLLYFIFSLI